MTVLDLVFTQIHLFTVHLDLGLGLFVLDHVEDVGLKHLGRRIETGAGDHGIGLKHGRHRGGLRHGLHAFVIGCCRCVIAAHKKPLLLQS